MNALPVPVTFVASSAEAGGAELYLLSLLEWLGEDWVDRVVVPGEGELSELARAAGHRVELVDFGHRLGLMAGAVRLRSLLHGQRPALVHANGSRAALLCALGPRRAPFVWLRVDRTLDGRVGTWIARRAARTVGISAGVLDGLAPGGWRGEVVYPGIPEYSFGRDAARAAVVELLGCGDDADVVVLSGRLGPGKGQRELLAATPALLRARPSARIALLGGASGAHPGYDRQLREQAAALRIAGRVHFLGRRRPEIRSQADAVRFVAGCDVLVAPSVPEPPYGWREGFGLAVAEAMAVGVPVVAYRHGSLPEVVGDCGVLVSEGDRPALGEAIAALLGDRSRRERLAGCGRDRVRELFSCGIATAAMKGVYRDCAGESAVAVTR